MKNDGVAEMKNENFTIDKSKIHSTSLILHFHFFLLHLYFLSRFDRAARNAILFLQLVYSHTTSPGNGRQRISFLYSH